MKGSAITGPVGKEAAELWPVRYTPFSPIPVLFSNSFSSVLPPTPVSSCKSRKRMKKRAGIEERNEWIPAGRKGFFSGCI